MRKFVLGSALLAFALSYAPFALSEELETLATPSTKDTIATTEKSMDKNAYTKNIHNSTYFGSGIVSMVFGFGTGHAIQGRWNDTGWIFTVSNVLLFGGMFTLLMSSLTSSFHVKLFSPNLAYKAMALYTLASVYFAFRLWEIIDVWSLPSHYYKIVKTPKLQISPVYTANYRDISTSGLGLSLKYNF